MDGQPLLHHGFPGGTTRKNKRERDPFSEPRADRRTEIREGHSRAERCADEHSAAVVEGVDQGREFSLRRRALRQAVEPFNGHERGISIETTEFFQGPRLAGLVELADEFFGRRGDRLATEFREPVDDSPQQMRFSETRWCPDREGMPRIGKRRVVRHVAICIGDRQASRSRVGIDLFSQQVIEQLGRQLVLRSVNKSIRRPAGGADGRPILGAGRASTRSGWECHH